MRSGALSGIIASARSERPLNSLAHRPRATFGTGFVRLYGLMTATKDDSTRQFSRPLSEGGAAHSTTGFHIWRDTPQTSFEPSSARMRHKLERSLIHSVGQALQLLLRARWGFRGVTAKSILSVDKSSRPSRWRSSWLRELDIA